MIYYIFAVEWLLSNDDNFKQYEDYSIQFQFLTVDTSNEKSRPLIYKPSISDIYNAEKGFKLKSGREYKGLDQLTNEILWHQDTGIWNISKDGFENKSILSLNLNYDNSK
jgi:hypothetical protein